MARAGSYRDRRVTALVLIQAIPVQRINPPITQDVAAPSEVEAVLRRAVTTAFE